MARFPRLAPQDRRLQGARRLLALPLLLLAGGVVSCGVAADGPIELFTSGGAEPELVYDWEVLAIPTPASIEIVPEVVYAEAGAYFRLEARVKDTNGEVFHSAFPNLMWTGPTGICCFPDHGPSTVVRTPLFASDESDLVVKTVTDIVASIGSITSAPATVVVANPNADPADLQDYQVIPLPHQTGSFPTAVMLDAHLDGSDRHDMIVAIAGRAHLKANLREGTAHDGPEVAAFSYTEPAYFLDGGQTTDPLDPADEPAISTSSSASFLGIETQPTATVKLVLWKGAHRTDQDVVQVMHWHALLAQTILKRYRTGIELEWDFERRESEVNETISPVICGSTDAADRALLGLDTLVNNEVLVVYADELDGVSGRGLSCESDRANFPLILIDVDNAAITTLAHELVHVLGVRGNTVYGSGHASSGFGFDCSNLMWPYSADFDCASNRRRLSLGQVFRVTWDERSWALQPPFPPGRGECQMARYNAEPCPCIQADLVERNVTTTTSCPTYQPFLVPPT